MLMRLRCPRRGSLQCSSWFVGIVSERARLEDRNAIEPIPHTYVHLLPPSRSASDRCCDSSRADDGMPETLVSRISRCFEHNIFSGSRRPEGYCVVSRAQNLAHLSRSGRKSTTIGIHRYMLAQGCLHGTETSLHTAMWHKVA